MTSDQKNEVEVFAKEFEDAVYELIEKSIIIWNNTVQFGDEAVDYLNALLEEKADVKSIWIDCCKADF